VFLELQISTLIIPEAALVCVKCEHLLYLLKLNVRAERTLLYSIKMINTCKHKYQWTWLIH